MKLKDPVTVVGDVHGQYYDLVKLLDVGETLKSQSTYFWATMLTEGVFPLNASF